jgi:hypothetical protein
MLPPPGAGFGLHPLIPTLFALLLSVQGNPDGIVETGPWQLAGPFDHPKGPVGVEDPHPPEELLSKMKPGMELNLSGLEWTGKGGAKIAWTLAVAPSIVEGSHPLDTGFINLATQPSNPQGIKGWSEYSATYLYRTVTLDHALRLAITMGSDDSVRFWLNGELQFGKNIPRGTNITDDFLYLPFKKGVNHILVKVVNGVGAAGFAMQKWRRIPQASIDRAIDRGMAYLMSTQLIDGSWGERQGAYRNGSTALALYALMKSGLPSKHPVIQKGFAFLKSSPAVKTYSLGCQMLAVAEAKDLVHLPWLEEMAADMGSWQLRGGMWAYPEGTPDLSCTQYAAFGLRAAAKRGIHIPTYLWEKLAKGVMTYQEKRNLSSSGTPAAGFAYRNGLPINGTGSMTTSGLAVLEICQDALEGKMGDNLRGRMNRSREMGKEWMGRNFTVHSNPKKGDQHYYYLYGLERAGSLLEASMFGYRDWYWEGAAFLVGKQGDNGDWYDYPSSGSQGREITTCFALLFLNRATLGPSTRQNEASKPRTGRSREVDGPVRLVVAAGPPASFWLETPGTTSAIGRVEYRVRFMDGGQWGYVGEVLPDPGSLGGDRFPFQHLFELPGKWEVRATVVLPDGSELESGSAALNAQEGIAPHQFRYGSDSRRNLLARRNPKVKASSESKGYPARNLVDNTAYGVWVCDKSDKDPWFEVALSSSVKVERILLTHSRTKAIFQDYHPRPSKVEIFLNRDKTPMVVDVLMDYREKTVIKLENPRRINRCKVRILEVSGGQLGKDDVGFTEIEFQSGPEDA